MFARAASVPADSDLLCEFCGYTLNGLPEEANCPECGRRTALSLQESGRTLTPWETSGAFWRTTARVIFYTGHFYRTLRTRVGDRETTQSLCFALTHWLLAGITIGIASGLHYRATLSPWAFRRMGEVRFTLFAAAWVAIVAIMFLVVSAGITRLAAFLTTWEAGWRGMRLPSAVVRRGLYYHAALLLPATLALLLIVVTHYVLARLEIFDYRAFLPYLYVLSGTAVAAAVYLFWTYWIGMKSMLYANV